MIRTMAHYEIPLDLPHAGTIARRVIAMFEEVLDPETEEHRAMLETSDRLDAILFDATWEGDNPAPWKAKQMAEQAAVEARKLVEQIEAADVGFDRLGQCMRNLFECLEMGEEGAELSLRAGEDPGSLQRPV